MPIFRLAMKPASDGDMLILSWGANSKPQRALIDLGRAGNYRAAREELTRIGRFELFVITHIDADHIEGVVPLLGEDVLPFSCNHVWFNAREQLKAASARALPPRLRTRGALQAEKVTSGLTRSGWARNAHFRSGIVSVDSPEATAPLKLAGNLKLILLSPTDVKLEGLISDWDAELERARLRLRDRGAAMGLRGRGRNATGKPNVEKLAAERFQEDDTRANGSSIAFVAEYRGKRILCAADAHPSALLQGLDRLSANKAERYKIDCFKVSHHGSKANTSPDLLKRIDCTCFAFSTDGSRHGHPDPEAIARILVNDPKRPKTLIFNSRQPSSSRWDDADLKKKWSYTCHFPESDDGGIDINLI